MQIRVLGCSGGVGKDLRTTSYLLNNEILLDGGTGVSDLSLDEMLTIRHVVLTHAHLDHVAGIALMIASIYDDLKYPITIYAPESVLKVLKTSMFNWHLWPDFTELPDESEPSIRLHQLEQSATFSITNEINLYPVILGHTVESFAYVISDQETHFCFCGDTGPTEFLWQELNEFKQIDHLMIECSFPNDSHELAMQSGHYTPQLLAKDLTQLKHSPVIHIHHIKPGCEQRVINQCHDALSHFSLNIVKRDALLDLTPNHSEQLNKSAPQNMEHYLTKLIEVGLSLSAEKDSAVLLDKILLAAKEITNADGGTIYTIRDEQFLQMDIVRNDSLSIAMGGMNKQQPNFAPIPLYFDNDEPNYSNVVTSAIHNDQVINIENRHLNTHYDFSGAQKFDESTGYSSISFLTIPMKNHKGKMIGALQLINALDTSGNTKAFNTQDSLVVNALASQASIALTNKNLIDELEALFESFIKMIADAIDEKSPYTGGHCLRVPELTIMLTEAVHDIKTGPLQDFSMTEDDRYELKIASWLHDCGKIITPEHVVDKATKLETIHDRIHEVNTRFELARRDLEITLLNQKLASAEAGRALDITLQQQYEQALTQLSSDQEFINRHNTGGEFMSPEDQHRVTEIANRYNITFYQHSAQPILSGNEIINMQISRGTLNAEERQIINKHINVTIDMLNSINLPPHLKNVPEIAGGHHERMDGKGYPFGLTRDQMSVQARVMGIADIFEALTAADRPYKKAKTISESLAIMKRMKNTGHIDPDIFNIFISEGIYLKYAKTFLEDFQIDNVDEEELLN